ncbi:aminotransferase class I/II-fold pyridoxal phosphate-dependent enzyme, partial [Clostridium saudiense]|nr:aminotransferase class I/II-fold pyridoxal phosphate-dependent enzyme [Clostridium saudiense]
LKYHKEKNLILSMPGNKSGIGFLKDDIGKEFVSTMGYLDITEVGNLDNFHHPEGVIKEAQELLAKLYKADRAYFLVNGSSSGNLASIFAAFNEGDEVLVERNCHKSIYNGLILRKLKPVYIEANIDLDNGILLPCSEKNIEEALTKAKHPRGIILTSPNYYGISCNLEKILRKLKANGLKILIDAAHGAHYGINKKKSISIVATHDRELTDILKDNYEFFYFSEKVNNNGLSFDYKLKKGVSKTRNAIKLLDHIGYPKEIIKKSYERAETLNKYM